MAVNSFAKHSDFSLQDGYQFYGKIRLPSNYIHDFVVGESSNLDEIGQLPRAKIRLCWQGLQKDIEKIISHRHIIKFLKDKQKNAQYTPHPKPQMPW